MRKRNDKKESKERYIRCIRMRKKKNEGEADETTEED